MSKSGHEAANEYSEADTCREFITPAIQAAGWGSRDEQQKLSTSIWTI